MISEDKLFKISTKLRALNLVATVSVLFLHGGGRSMDGGTELIKVVFRDCLFNGYLNYAVSFFFLVSGFLWTKNIDLRCHGLESSLKRRVVTLFIPYVVWNVLGYLIADVAGFESKGLLSDLGITYVLPLNRTMWYVRNLLVLFITSPILITYIRVISSRSWLEYLSFIGIVCLIFVTQSSMVWSVVYFTVGLWLGFNYHRCEQVLTSTHPRVLRVSIVLSLVLLIARCIGGIYGVLSPMAFMWVIIPLTIIILWLGYDYIPREIVKAFMVSKFGNAVLKTTFFVYCFHTFINAPIYSKLDAAFVLPVIMYIISFLTAITLIKIAPFVYKVLSGGR